MEVMDNLMVNTIYCPVVLYILSKHILQHLVNFNTCVISFLYIYFRDVTIHRYIYYTYYIVVHDSVFVNRFIILM
jgi:hypothetical protein